MFRVALAGLLAVLSTAAITAEGTTCAAGLTPGPTRTVVRVLDGETLALDDGTELRLIGALAPRAIDSDADPGAWPAETAATEALSGFVLGKSVEIRFGGARADRYGRVRAHAFLIEGEARRWVQGELVERGLARAYALPVSRVCAEALLAVERSAREESRGLWAEAAYQVRTADSPAELLRYRTTFQIVEGRIVRVGQTRGTIYLNFDRNWRRGFSASLRRDDSGMLGAYASDPKGLEGRSVRVRGWIEQRGGAPAIDLSSGGLVEIMSGGDTPPAQPR